MDVCLNMLCDVSEHGGPLVSPALCLYYFVTVKSQLLPLTLFHSHMTALSLGVWIFFDGRLNCKIGGCSAPI